MYRVVLYRPGREKCLVEMKMLSPLIVRPVHYGYRWAGTDSFLDPCRFRGLFNEIYEVDWVSTPGTWGAAAWFIDAPHTWSEFMATARFVRLERAGALVVKFNPARLC